MDNNVPLLGWANESGIRISGKPVKVIFVETFALSFWSNLGSFAEIDKDVNGIITPDNLEHAIATKLGLDCNFTNDARYLKFLVDDIMAVADMNLSGTIDLALFLAAKLTASIQEVTPSQRMAWTSMRRPSIFLERITVHELGRNAQQSLVQLTVQSVKYLVLKQDFDHAILQNSDEDHSEWHDSLTCPNLSISSMCILG